jgi:hypothetical protein
MTELDNPFGVTKATDFSDQEINEYWVNIGLDEDHSIKSILNPTDLIPKYVIGSKGCGKTHILKYLSFDLQRIRYKDEVSALLESDQYIGIYSLLSGLNSSRFRGKNVSDAEWKSVFEYYFELYVVENLLQINVFIFEKLEVEPASEKRFVQSVLELLNNPESTSSISTVGSLIRYIAYLRGLIDLEIQNAAFNRSLNYDRVRILFSPGDLIFGVPKRLASFIDKLDKLRFVYIFDEYEKLFEWQKIFVNTLVWERKAPVSFWIGARTYGYTTRETLTGENMKVGSEFEEVNLDSIIRSDEDLYKEFAKRVLATRLTKFYERRNLQVEPEDAAQPFRDRFERYDESKVISRIVKKYEGREFEHLVNFKTKLIKSIGYSERDIPANKLAEISRIVDGIQEETEGNPLEQKYKLFHFYYLWHHDGGNTALTTLLEAVNHEYKLFKTGEKSKFEEIRDKRKKDLIAQLTKESRVRNLEYSGIDDFIKLSSGNPRTFLIILKKVIEYSSVRGERPLEDGSKISLDSQYFGVHSTAEFFYNDAEPAGENGRRLYRSLKYLTDYFIQERFSDKPVETTVSCFWVRLNELSIEARDCINQMEVHSIIIENQKGRTDKNSDIKEKMYQLNRTVAPYWNLPIAVRGSIFLDNDVAEAIFNFQHHDNFIRLYKKRHDELNAPEFLKVVTNQQSLFE